LPDYATSIFNVLFFCNLAFSDKLLVGDPDRISGKPHLTKA